MGKTAGDLEQHRDDLQLHPDRVLALDLLVRADVLTLALQKLRRRVPRPPAHLFVQPTVVRRAYVIRLENLLDPKGGQPIAAPMIPPVTIRPRRRRARA